MSLRILTSFCLLMVYLTLTTLNAEEEQKYYVVIRSGVVHKFAQTGTPWIDEFLTQKFPSWWEADTFATFEKVKDKDGIAIDLGAWIGTTAIWLSKNFHYVIAVDADKESIEYLEKNLKASDCNNVLVCNKAISADGKPVIFGPRLGMQHGDALNGSTSFVKTQKDSNTDYVVSSLTLDQMFDQYVKKNDKLNSHKISFIKCDIEGGEEFVLESVLQYALANNCKVWMSFHYDWWKNRNIANYEPLFKKFKTDCPIESVTEYVIKSPFASVLFEPLPS